jgi:hypothetical protein
VARQGLGGTLQKRLDPLGTVVEAVLVAEFVGDLDPDDSGPDGQGSQAVDRSVELRPPLEPELVEVDLQPDLQPATGGRVDRRLVGGQRRPGGRRPIGGPRRQRGRDDRGRPLRRLGRLPGGAGGK